ncbi:MAG TPA: type II toxin-antitoxin system VapC family toxin [Ktedonobacterales bacterium]|nr:type II toxin-antitoxin system VapC family toxin [Ktedonobacterales bacterium]
MTRYLLDNGVLVAYLRGHPGALRLVRPWITAREAATSHLVYGEAIEYLKGSSDYRRRRAELRELLREVIPYQLTYPILERYADLRRAMPRTVGIIGNVDTLIAATELEHKLTVDTLDGDLTRVPGLSVMHLPRSALMA